MLKEIDNGGLMMLAFKISMPLGFGSFQYVICGIYGLINVKIVLNKATDAVLV